ncbi:peroxynitrite isomerase THAP4-like [Babylonia areolata]|uniref:peroxynitrite isomerase THAP4-like n=1 Tax=Babylonia areolata TaxID=304850 RepID=UPI003FD58B23
MSKSEAPVVHEMIQPLAWILGKWRAEEGGSGQYPTINNFEYGEEAEFFTVGQPNVQFSLYSWNAQSKIPLHREIGFIRIKPGTNKIALISAQNSGVTDIEEGEVKDGELTVETTTIHRISFSKEPETKKVVRTFQRTGDELKQVLSMETSRTPLTEHLSITYKKVD